MQALTFSDVEHLRVNPAYQCKNVFGRKKLYMNWGLWDNTTIDLDDAAFALVMKIGQLANLEKNTKLLDVGFGFGDQLIDWALHTELGSAEGINICPEQTTFTKKRLADAGLSDRIHVQTGSALSLPFETNVFSAVTAVECAFHFHTRKRFFAEARRVLKTRGLLVLADFIGTEKPNWRQRFTQWVATHYWGFAPNSFCSKAEYINTLEMAGFENISIEQVTDRVLKPGIAYARGRLRDADLCQRMGKGTWLFMNVILFLSFLLGDPIPGEYILVRAQCKS